MQYGSVQDQLKRAPAKLIDLNQFLVKAQGLSFLGSLNVDILS